MLQFETFSLELCAFCSYSLLSLEHMLSRLDLSLVVLYLMVHVLGKLLLSIDYFFTFIILLAIFWHSIMFSLEGWDLEYTYNRYLMFIFEKHHISEISCL